MPDTTIVFLDISCTNSVSYSAMSDARTDTDMFLDWLAFGVDKGWCSEVVCSTHDGLPPLDDDEEEQWEAGYDPCVPAVRIYFED